MLLDDSLHLVRGRRVGLVTNHTGRNRAGTPSIDLLADHPEVELVALYSPEHGIRGREEAGVRVTGGRDGRTGLPIHSLYGATTKPTPEMLAGVDVLLFDIQDVGARYYTYLSTMALAMEAAGEAEIEFVVLDRPNPVGGEAVQGNLLDPDFASFVGLYPVPMRHGLTAGEFARMAVGEFGVRVELSVAVADGWTRAMLYAETGIPWVAPSPNMPSVTSALHYSGTCLFEGTPISVGRGTPMAFQHLGAPWLDGDALATRLNAIGVPGVAFRPTRFTPVNPGDGKFAGEEVYGVVLEAVGEDYDPTLAALALLTEIRAVSGDLWRWRSSHFDRLAGSDRLRLQVEVGGVLPGAGGGVGRGVGGLHGAPRAVPAVPVGRLCARVALGTEMAAPTLTRPPGCRSTFRDHARTDPARALRYRTPRARCLQPASPDSSPGLSGLSSPRTASGWPPGKS